MGKVNKNQEDGFITSLAIKRKFYGEFLPFAITSTLLAPMTRLKVILQTNPLIAIEDTQKTYSIRNLFMKVIKEQGIVSLWRGNVPSIYKSFIQTYTYLLLFNSFNPDNKLPWIILGTSASVILTYPLDLVQTRMSCDMTRYGFKRINGTTIEVLTRTFEEDSKISINYLALNRFNMNFAKPFKGLSLSLLSNSLYWTITFASLDKLNRYFYLRKMKLGEDLNNLSFLGKMLMSFGPSIVNSILTSTILYPLDTFKRHIQVNNSLGFNSEYQSFNDGVRKFVSSGIVNMYRGYSLQIFFKALPLSFLHYTISNSMINKYMEE